MFWPSIHTEIRIVVWTVKMEIFQNNDVYAKVSVQCVM